MTEQLAALLKRLNRLSYDELISFANKLEHDLADPLITHPDLEIRMKGERIQKLIRQSHRGTSLEKIRMHLRAINEEIHFAQLLSEDEQQIAIQMARTLHQALQPVEGRRKPRKRQNKTTGMIEEVGNGRVEIKYIRIPIYDFDTGARLRDDQISEQFPLGRPLSRGAAKSIGYAPEIPGYGPYVYVRVWATGGGKARDEKRLKSRYVGTSGLAAEFLKLEPGSEERQGIAEQIIGLYVSGGSKAVRAWAAIHYPDPEGEELLDESELEQEEEAPIKAAVHETAFGSELVLPFRDQPLTKDRRSQLYQFFADEYQKRHGRAWRFFSGAIVPHPGGKYHLTYKLYAGDVASIRTLEFKSREDMEHTLTWIVKTGGDLEMTLDR